MASMITRRDAARMAASAVLALGLPLRRAAAVLRRGVGAAPGLPGGADSAWPHLPRGVSRRELDKALGGFAKVVGGEWVFRSEQDVALYRDAYSIYWGEGEEKVASAAVAPRTTQEVVEIVRVANRHGIPLYPISTGKNLGYGGSAPVLSGSVVLDLKRMDRVLEVNERHAYALVEPGVSYLDLHQYIRERGLKVWIDCPGPGWGSVIGNSLDRGVGYTLADFRNHFEAHCGMEVVLPTGELMRTGMGAMPNAETWQQFKPGYGPWVDGLFSQSNFGIVTKMGFWLMPQPEAFGTGRVGVPRYRDMITLVDVISRLEAGHIVRGFMSFSSPVAGIGMPGAPDGALSSQHDPEIASLLSDPGGFSAQKLEAIGLRKGIPFWSCDFNFYGPQKLIEAQLGVRAGRVRIPLGCEMRVAADLDDAADPTAGRLDAGYGLPRGPDSQDVRPGADDELPRRACRRPHILLAGRAAHGRSGARGGERLWRNHAPASVAGASPSVPLAGLRTVVHLRHRIAGDARQGSQQRHPRRLRGDHAGRATAWLGRVSLADFLLRRGHEQLLVQRSGIASLP